MKDRTCRYFTGDPLIPFGYGLSYTTLAYNNLQAPKETTKRSTVRVSVDVVNTGKMTGDEVVRRYIRNPNATASAPLRSLAGFSGVSLAPGAKKLRTIN